MGLAVSLAKPDLRREMEADLKRICNGTKTGQGAGAVGVWGCWPALARAI